MKKRLAALSLGLLVLSQVPVIEARRASQAPVIDGVRAMRTALSNYIDARGKGPRYGTVADAVKNLQGWQIVGAETAVFVNYQLRITKSQDEQSFQASLTTSTKCAPAWFSSEQGVIYVAKAIGCD